MSDDLFYPEIVVLIGEYTFTAGVEIEVYSSADSYFDWAKVRFTGQYQDAIAIPRLAAASIQLGYNGLFTEVFQGFVTAPYNHGGSQNEIILKDTMILLEDTLISNTFLAATPQEIVHFVLGKSGVQAWQLSLERYGQRATVPIVRRSGILAIGTVSSVWGINPPLYARAGLVYWGVIPPQAVVYGFAYGDNIIALTRQGGRWELETVSAPMIHHGDLIRVEHPAVSGEYRVTKVIFSTAASGFIRTYIYF